MTTTNKSNNSSEVSVEWAVYISGAVLAFMIAIAKDVENPLLKAFLSWLYVLYSIIALIFT